MMIELESPGANETKTWESVNTDLETVSDGVTKDGKEWGYSKNNGITSNKDKEWSVERIKKENADSS